MTSSTSPRLTRLAPRHARTTPSRHGSVRIPAADLLERAAGATANRPAPPTSTPESPDAWRRGAGLLAASQVFIGVANYATALLMARLISAQEFSRFAAGQSLLLVLGTGSMAALPWAVSRYLASPQYDRSPSKALGFGLAGSAMQAVVLGAVALAVAWQIGGAGFAVTICTAVIMISLLAGPIGFFQGRNQLGTVAAGRVVETVVRIAVGILLVLALTRTSTVALIGFPVGSALALGWLLWRARSGFPLAALDRGVALHLTRQALLLGGIQVLLAMVGALDTVYAGSTGLPARSAAAYQSAALIGRIPLFLSVALATASYTAMVRAPEDQAVGRILRSCAAGYGWVVVPFVVACWSMPGDLLYAVIPHEYTQALSLLKITSLVGVTIGAVNVLTTAHQARGRFRGGLLILGVGVVVQAAVLALVSRTSDVAVFALADLVVCVAILFALAIDGQVWLRLRPSRLSWHAIPTLALAAVALLEPPTAVWLPVIAALGLVCLHRVVRAPGPSPSTRQTRHHREESS